MGCFRGRGLFIIPNFNNNLLWLQKLRLSKTSMQKPLNNALLLWSLFIQAFFAFGQEPPPFSSTPLKGEKDYSDLMVEGIARFLDRESAKSINHRQQFWEIDFSNKEAYEQSLRPNRERLAKIIGAVDLPVPHREMEYIATTSVPAKVAENDFFITYAVRWEVFEGVYGEGLLLQPKGKVKARIVAIPDADQTPEMLIGLDTTLAPEIQYARQLAENGCQVVIPTIIDRKRTGSGSQRMDRFTNQPHREWIYRQAFTFGRHVIGYEVQKILAAVDWFANQVVDLPSKIGVVGWGEGALLGFYGAAIDPRIDVALISGYFSKRENLWKEPIYRNISGFLAEFGDAEVASLVVPRSLIIEYAASPDIKGPPKALDVPSRLGASAAPGKITTPSFEEVEEEVERAKQLSGKFHASIQFIHDNRKMAKGLGQASLLSFLQQLQPGITSMSAPEGELSSRRTNFNPEKRQLRQVRELENHTQKLIESSRHVRDDFFWEKMEISTPESWEENTQYFKEYFWDKVIGRILSSNLDLNPKSQQIYDEQN
jgi:hypothetical protein